MTRKRVISGKPRQATSPDKRLPTVQASNADRNKEAQGPGGIQALSLCLNKSPSQTQLEDGQPQNPPVRPSQTPAKAQLQKGSENLPPKVSQTQALPSKAASPQKSQTINSMFKVRAAAKPPKVRAAGQITVAPRLQLRTPTSSISALSKHQAQGSPATKSTSSTTDPEKTLPTVAEPQSKNAPTPTPTLRPEPAVLPPPRAPSLQRSPNRNSSLGVQDKPKHLSKAPVKGGSTSETSSSAKAQPEIIMDSIVVATTFPPPPLSNSTPIPGKAQPPRPQAKDASGERGHMPPPPKKPKHKRSGKGSLLDMLRKPPK